MRLFVDTGVFSASLSRRRCAQFETYVQRVAGQQVFVAAVTVSELRFGALVAQWGEARRHRLEQSIQAATVVPVSEQLAARRRAPLPVPARGSFAPRPNHANGLWIAASAIHIEAPLLTADRVFENTPGLTLVQ